MTRFRLFRLAFSLALAFLAVGLGALSVQRKIQTFQPLGFEATSQGVGFVVAGVNQPEAGLKTGDQILLVNGGEVSTRSQLTSAKSRRAS